MVLQKVLLRPSRPSLLRHHKELCKKKCNLIFSIFFWDQDWKSFFIFLFFARLFTLTRKKVLVPTFGRGLLSVISKVNILNLQVS